MSLQSEDQQVSGKQQKRLDSLIARKASNCSEVPQKEKNPRAGGP